MFVYVDEILLLGNAKSVVDEIVNLLQSNYDIRVSSKIYFLMGMIVGDFEKSLKLHIVQTIEQVLLIYVMEACRKV